MSGSAPPPSFADPPTEVDEPDREPVFAADPAPPTRTAAELEALVHAGLEHVGPVAKQLARRLGQRVELDELASLGRVALLAIARDFDPSRSAFPPFVRRRLRWAILDGLRRDTGARGVRGRALALTGAERVAEVALEPVDPDASEAAHGAQLRRALSAHATAMVLGLVAGDRALTDSTDDPDRVVDRLRFYETLRGAVAALPPKQRELVERHYFGDERFDRIAESMGLSKSWASRLHAQAMERLGEVLAGHR